MLVIENVEKQFGALTALSRFSLKISRGEVLGIIGPNGSGKTTLVNIVTGVSTPSAGRITYQDADITGWRGSQIARLGIVRTFQNIRLFPTMSVFQNVWAAQHSRISGGLLGLIRSRPTSRCSETRKVEEVLDLVGLLKDRDVLAKHLPLPACRYLEIARALAVDPQLVFLDEPAGGMTPAETADMVHLIQDVVAPGRTCVVIEHKMALIMGVCTRLCVLDFGCKIAEGHPSDVLASKDVREVYLGKDDGSDA